ncbi:hypothetical protein [Janthinobacterium sp. GW458P]|uniref:hypothetical protein n=1 Tax=Janthinobacterium sp. GW458P TaxID=1981504 RepID=UPI00111FE86A|nr:hypothetical protein [Janthinobacterium sp. GW458P]MBE3025878.1 hypothetical protein [Janthinobacterium sp. GW458P]
MNKKLAAFLFASGLGLAVTATPAFASCYSACAAEWRACIAGGTAQAECNAERSACQQSCN